MLTVSARLSIICDWRYNKIALCSYLIPACAWRTHLNSLDVWKTKRLRLSNYIEDTCWRMLTVTICYIWWRTVDIHICQMNRWSPYQYIANPCNHYTTQAINIQLCSSLWISTLFWLISEWFHPLVITGTWFLYAVFQVDILWFGDGTLYNRLWTYLELNKWSNVWASVSNDVDMTTHANCWRSTVIMKQLILELNTICLGHILWVSQYWLYPVVINHNICDAELCSMM